MCFFHCCWCLPGAACAKDLSNANGLVNDANTTLSNFIADPNMTWFRDNIDSVKGVLIVPRLGRAGFIFGGSGGTGVLLARDEKTGKWSYPAFYTTGSASWGLQIGVQVAEVVLMVMTQKGIDSMLSTKFKLGGDVSVAAGPVGAGVGATTADILQFARTKGVFGGLTLEGAVIGIRESLNTAFYGKAVRPVDILISRSVSNEHANPLRLTLTKKKPQVLIRRIHYRKEAIMLQLQTSRQRIPRTVSLKMEKRSSSFFYNTGLS